MGLGYYRRYHNSKFIYRWQSTKYFAKEAEERRRKIKSNDDKTKILGIMISMIILTRVMMPQI